MVPTTTFTLFKPNIQRWRPYGRGTSFVVSFVLALNMVNVVAVTTILVLHVGVIGYHVPRHYDFMFPRRAYHARLRGRGVQGALMGLGFQGRYTPQYLEQSYESSAVASVDIVLWRPSARKSKS